MGMNEIKEMEAKKSKEDWKINAIVKDFDVLTSLAKTVDSITELGVRRCFSAYAWLLGQPKKFVGVDISRWPEWDQLEKDVEGTDIELELIVANDIEVELEETDLLFIDSLHTYDHVTKQLELHADKAKKYIVFHDALDFDGKPAQVHLDLGVYNAIMDFLDKTEEWKVIEHIRPCQVLIIERVKDA